MPNNYFKVGDRLKRKKIQAFRYSPDLEGVVVEKKTGNRYKIKWDEKASTGQQHSTVQGKFLERVS